MLYAKLLDLLDPYHKAHSPTFLPLLQPAPSVPTLLLAALCPNGSRSLQFPSSAVLRKPWRPLATEGFRIPSLSP